MFWGKVQHKIHHFSHSNGFSFTMLHTSPLSHSVAFSSPPKETTCQTVSLLLCNPSQLATTESAWICDTVSSIPTIKEKLKYFCIWKAWMEDRSSQFRNHPGLQPHSVADGQCNLVLFSLIITGWLYQVKHLAQQIMEWQGLNAHGFHPSTLLLREVFQLAHGEHLLPSTSIQRNQYQC